MKKIVKLLYLFFLLKLIFFFSGGQNSPTNDCPTVGSVGYTATATSCSSEEDPTSPVQEAMSPQVQATVVQQAMPRTTCKTALDVINETIVKTLDSPLNLVKSQPQSQQVILISQVRF